MNYSLVNVLFIGALVIQCSCRPQQADTSSDSPSTTEAAMTDTTESLVFDEDLANSQDGDNENGGGTTEMPTSEIKDGETTITPCDGDECGSGLQMDMENTGASTEPSTDGEQTTMSENETGETTTQAPESSP